MAIDTQRARIISLLNRDFRSLKRDLMTYAQAYATASFTDYNESSPGMTMLEFAAYVGDGLNYYIDQSFNEMRDQTAVQVENVQFNAKMKGYRPAGKRAARGQTYWAVEVPATTNTLGQVVPDDAYTPSLLKGSQAIANNGTPFETLDDISFTASLGREVTGSQFDRTTGVPTYFAIRKPVDCVAGKTVTDVVSVGDFKAFYRLDLSQNDVIEVISVFDSQGNEWVEVEHLAQDWVFVTQTNTNSDNDVVPYVLKLKSAPYRFVVDRDIVTGVSTLVFGSGDGLNFDDELVPNLASFALPLAGRRTYASFAIDPQNFLTTRSLGLSPHNTTLTVTYRVGGGPETNVPARTIRRPGKASLSFSSTNLDPVKQAAVISSVGVINLLATTGGGPAETIQEIKLNSSAYFAAQDRAVTREDIVARVLSMPAALGKPEKVYVKQSIGNRASYDVHVLALDSEGHLVLATPTLKANVATHLRQYKMLTDGVNILDGDIINLRCHFGIVVDPGKNRSEVLTNCASSLAGMFDIKNMQINQPIAVSEVVTLLHTIAGVRAVYDVSFRNVFDVTDGLSYSQSIYDVSRSLQNGMLICPPGSIFEIKYPNRDFVGSAR